MHKREFLAAAAVGARPVADRFANCPWAVFHIDVQA